MKSMISDSNMSAKRFFLKIGDLVLFALIVALGITVLFLFAGGNHTVVTVTQHGEQIYRFDLSDATLEGEEVSVKGAYENTICIKDGKLYVSEASCPDRLCMQSLPLTEKGGVICCVPNGLIITAESDAADWDVVIR